MRAIVCDDDITSLNYLISCVEKLKYTDLHITTVNSGENLLLFLDSNSDIDILIIDIDLGDSNGIDIAKKIKAQNPNILIIFVTGYIDFAGDIFEADPVYFVVKPVKMQKLKLALDKALSQIENRKGQLIQISNRGHIVNININDILYIESYARKIIIFESSTEYQAYIKLGDIEKKLPNSFIRCHQSFLVNMRFAQRIMINNFVMLNGVNIPISRSRYKKTADAFAQFIGGSICHF